MEYGFSQRESAFRRHRNVLDEGEGGLEPKPVLEVVEVARLRPVMGPLGEPEYAVPLSTLEVLRRRVELKPEAKNREAEDTVEEAVERESASPDGPVAAALRVLEDGFLPDLVPGAGAARRMPGYLAWSS